MSTDLRSLLSVNCLCCGEGKSFRADPGSNVGTMAGASGYEPIMMKDTSMRWMCPSCVVRVIPHVRALVDFLHDPLVFWDGLPHLLKRKEEGS